MRVLNIRGIKAPYIFAEKYVPSQLIYYISNISFSNLHNIYINK